jgi:isopenicillin N synthase-like dioxygenase
MALPTLNFSLFTKGTDAQREQLGSAISESFRKHGFVKLINHGVPQDMLDKLFAIVRKPNTI